MIHIVFNESEVDLMQKVIELDETLAGPVIQIKDDFAVGPLMDLDIDEGWQARVAWWRNLLQGSPYKEDTAGSFDDRQTVKEIQEKLAANSDEQVWIWMGQNQHDVSGYYWLMPQLRDYQGRIMILYLNSLPFINEKGQIFYPSWLHEIQPREFLKAKKLSRPITLSEFEVDPDERKKLAQENATVRILEGAKKITGQGENYFDAELIKNAGNEWQKANRVLSNTLNRMKVKTGDVFLMWRLKELVNQGKLQMMGDPSKGWKDFDVRLPGAANVEADAGAKATVND